MMRCLMLCLLTCCMSACAAPRMVPEQALSLPGGRPLHFTGLLHRGSSVLPVQGVLSSGETNLRYAVVTQNGIVLGMGTIDYHGRVTVVNAARGIGAAMDRMGGALADFLRGAMSGTSTSWKPAGENIWIWRDKGVELSLRHAGAPAPQHKEGA